MALKTDHLAAILLTVVLLSAKQSRAQQYYALDFAENKGQWAEPVQFRSQVGNGVIFIEKQGFTVLKNKEEDWSKAMQLMHGHGADTIRNGKDQYGRPVAFPVPTNSVTIRSHAYRVRFLGSLPDAVAEPDRNTGEVINYYIGNDPSKWKSGVRSFQAVTYRNIYPNVDVRYYSGSGSLKYDLIVHPGADLSRIRMRYEGADRISVRNGQLVIQTSVGEARELSPYSYQVVNGLKQEVDCQYSVSGDQVRFKVSGYDKNADLVIDPQLIFCTFTGSKASNWGYTATPGPDGSFFAGGIVFGQGYPVTAGAYQANFGGGGTLGIDVSITRLAPNGRSRIYSTYLGGSGDDYPHSMFADQQGNLVVLGRTNSDNFPSTNNNYAGTDFDIFVTKFAADGRSLIGSLRIGGSRVDGANIDPGYPPPCGSLVYNYGDNQRSEVILDAQNNVWVAASTQSDDFPMKNAVAPRSKLQDAVLIKLAPDLSSVLFSTCFGGAGNDAGFVLAQNPVSGNIFLAGGTESKDLPGNKTGVIQPTASNVKGDIDGYIAEFTNTATPSLVRATYLSTKNVDIVYGIQFDRSGFPYVMGISLGTWPIVNAAYQNAGAHQFISKLKADLSGYMYSTVFGSPGSVPNISPVAFLVDRCENVYVSGWGGALNVCSGGSDCFDNKTLGPANMPITSNAIKKTTDNRDFYFFVMEKDAASQLYGSFFGQTGGEGDHVDGGTSRYDKRGVIYQAICANCGGDQTGSCSPVTGRFPTTAGAVAPINGALNAGGTQGDCNLGAVKILFDFDGVKAGAQASINGVSYDTSGCAPLLVDFTDTLGIGKSYQWDFGDNSPIQEANTAATSHKYLSPGYYKVTLVAKDPNKCITNDTSYTHIRVRSDPAQLDLTGVKLPPCESLTYQFTNTSVPYPGKTFNDNSFLWDFGDGSPRVKAGTGIQTHVYPSPGTYPVRLILIDTNFCNAPDSLSRSITLVPNVKAGFDTPLDGCMPYSAVFDNTSVAGQVFTWDFGDNTTYVGRNPPPHAYLVGSYTITLKAEDATTCNKVDVIQKTITVHEVPISGFFWSPQPSQENTPTQFTNASTGAVRYSWDFGDGDTSILQDPLHQYKATKNFSACLFAYNQFACYDSVCQEVPAIIRDQVDFPNAFSPNGDGVNDRFYVRGYGITKLDFRVYNRWGQLVYYSADQSQGWDGKFNGVLQPMDSYAVIVDVVFFDNVRTTKKGDVTLLR